MPTQSNVAVQQISEFRVEKSRAGATLMLSNGMCMQGHFFVAGNSRTHAGPEGVKDVLNAEDGFFPFEVEDCGNSDTVLLNRDHVVFLELADIAEARRDPGYDVATERIVTVLFSNGVRLQGAVRVFRPQGRDRLSDFARAQETFRYLESDDATYVFNVRHVIELVEEIAAS
jgi:sRNA-binding regulator protein Hfq